MIKKFSLLPVTVLLALPVNSAFPQGTARYFDDIFSTVTKTSDITFGQNKSVNGSTVILKLDVYQPTGDTTAKRPVVIFGHGGTFIGGSKTDGDVVTLCNRFAKKGYVTVSYNYRIGIGFPFNQQTASQAVYRATQDAKAVVRFLYKDASSSNTFKIDTNFIYLGGSSAGAFIALHYAYLDDPAELPAYLDTTGLGNMEGNSGNPGFSSKVNAVINLSGALGDTSWMAPGDEPACSMHGTADQTVPYGTGMIYISGFPIMVVDGSSTVDVKANMTGITHSFYTWPGADHAPYASGASPDPAAYMDTTVDFIRDFLCEQSQLCVVQPGIDKRENSAVYFKLIPSQTGDKITILPLYPEISFTAEISDVLGKVIMRHESNGKPIVISKNEPRGGIYLVKITVADGTSQVEKIYFKEK
ncbi:MAG: carboxylesterase family protein [Bacteroidetes bacterium]|nr:carboxylesterase family protein [Bacteroidota bacterium]